MNNPSKTFFELWLTNCSQTRLLMIEKMGHFPSAEDKSSPGSLAVPNALLLELKSRVCAETGDQEHMFMFAKQSMYLLQQAWALLEKQNVRSKPRDVTDASSDTSSLIRDVEKLSLRTDEAERDTLEVTNAVGSDFWPLVRPLLQSLLCVVQAAKHCGDYQEAIYACKQAEKLAENLGSDMILANVLVEHGDVVCRSGESEQGQQYLSIAEAKHTESDQSKELAHRHRCMGSLHHLRGQCSAEVRSYDIARNILQEVSSSKFLTLFDGIDMPVDLLIETLIPQQIAPSTAQKASQTSKASSRTRKKKDEKLKERSRSLEPVPINGQVHECFEIELLQNDLSRLTVECFLDEGRSSQARKISSHLLDRRCSTEQHAQIARVRAKQSLTEGLSIMSKDSVSGMLIESALSLPATSPACEEGVREAQGPRREGLHDDSSIDHLARSLGLVSRIFHESALSCSTFTLSRCLSVLISSSLLLSFSRVSGESHCVHAAKVACAIGERCEDSLMSVC